MASPCHRMGCQWAVTTSPASRSRRCSSRGGRVRPSAIKPLASESAPIPALISCAVALPAFVAMGAWGTRWLPANEAPRGQFLEAGGPPLWERFRAELRQEHLECGLPPGARPCAPRWKQPIRGSLQVRQTTRQRGRSPPGDAVTAPFSWRKWTNEALEQYTMPVSPALRRRLASFALVASQL